MKFNKWTLGLAASAALALVLTSGCASAHVNSTTDHRITQRGAVLPPGWSAVLPNVTNTATGNQVTQFNYCFTGTNAPGFFSPRPHIFVAYEESWTDTSKGGGTFLLTDPKASELNFSHSNQVALGGGRVTQVGEIESLIGTNSIGLVNAAGSLAGTIAADIINKTTPVGAANGAAAKVTGAVK